ncbi:hypothetical protein ACTL6P_03565 [Endozoicomonas acroporae]|uniref:hypothetical protein n=1 Tax=Endozoicomonas acroporae TaxID=1701104 RepID=UPI000C782494
MTDQKGNHGPVHCTIYGSRISKLMDTPDTVLWLKKKPFGPQASTIFYSLIEGGKANGLEPYDYLCREL